jgi:putative transposase
MLTVVTGGESTPATSVSVPMPVETAIASTGGSLIDEIVREGVRRMLAAALEAEVAAYIAAHADQLDERGRRQVVRNGRAEPRQLLTSAGAVKVVAPRVNDKRVDEAGG